MDLDTLVDLSGIAAALTVIGGTVFAILQLKEFRLQRQEAVAHELMSAFMGPEFVSAMMTITSLPDDLSADDLKQAGLETQRAANLMCTTFEAIGVLVHRRIAPLPLVQDLAGGVTLMMWRRLRPWILQIRRDTANPADSEWFQWLAEQLERRKHEKVPAYERHRDWMP